MNIQEIFDKVKIFSKELLMYENYILYTKLSEGEIFERIQNVSGNDYYKRIVGNQFQMYRFIGYRNSCLPYVQGTLFPEKGITFISIRARLHPVMKILLVLFIFFPILIFISPLFEQTETNVSADKITTKILIIPLAVYFIGLAFFKFECKIIKWFIVRLLDGKFN
ncbi:hypothetical protein [Leptospira sarikeiensis]|uniref:Uncharacterized protein n=1 Tax=Leptospira sarikeiensis TaxID=2484943 RepID=A0A4R9JYK6_9LEPT|nr:hypothetical protein [Leptospira sarikeiensis]TGL57657.1 hypothetical protein EHQ64_19890 [Leptospira sarikeiensis]